MVLPYDATTEQIDKCIREDIDCFWVCPPSGEYHLVHERHESTEKNVPHIIIRIVHESGYEEEDDVYSLYDVELKGDEDEK